MIFDFQFTRDALERLLHAHLEAHRPCFPSGIAVEGETIYVSRVDIGLTEIQRSETPTILLLNDLVEGEVKPPTGATVVAARLVQVKQALTLHLAQRSDMIASNTEQSPTFPLHIRAVLDLRTEITKTGTARLCARLHRLTTPSGEPLGLDPQLLQEIGEKADFCTPIRLDFLSGPLATLGATFPSTRTINSGLAIRPDLSAVCLRMDLDPPDTDAQDTWSAFHEGDFGNRLNGHDWAVAIPKPMILDPLQQTFAKLIGEGSESFALASGPDVSWEIEDGNPRIVLDLSGELIDACIGIDIDVDVTATVSPSVPAPRVLRLTLDLEWAGNVGETFACELVTATFWPIVGATLVADEKLGWEAFIPLTVGWQFSPNSVFASEVAYLSSDEPAAQFELPGWQEVDGSPAQRQLEVEVPATFGGFSLEFHLLDVRGTTNHLILNGALVDPPAPVFPTLETAVAPFMAYTKGGCGYSPPVLEARIGLIAEPMGETPRMPLRVCRFRIVEDPKKQFEIDEGPGTRILSSAEAVFRLSGPLKPAYEAAPYPLRVEILSANGCRLISIPPPPPPPDLDLSPEEKKIAELKALTTMIVNCMRPMSIWGLLGVFNPKWHVDPPPDLAVLRSWSIAAGGLPVGDVVALEDFAGRELVSARVGPSGAVEVSALVDGRGPGADVTLSRNGARLSAEEYERRAASVPNPARQPATWLRMSQLLLVRQAALPLGAAPDAFGTFARRGAAMLYVATGRETVLYRLDDPFHPVEESRHVARGATLRLGELWAWDEEGVGPISASGRRHALAGIRDVGVRGRYLFLLTGTELRALDPDGGSRASVPIEGATRLAVAHDRLAVATPEGIAVFDLSRPDAPREAGFVRRPGVARVGSVRGGGRASAIFVVDAGGTGIVLDLAEPERPAEMLEFHAPPWHVAGWRNGRWYARVEGTGLGLYHVAGRHAGLGPRLPGSEIWPVRRPRPQRSRPAPSTHPPTPTPRGRA